MEEDVNVILELACLVSNNKKEVCGFWIILFLSKEVWRKKTNNMLSLMLNPRFMSLCLIFSLIGLEQSKAIVEEHKSLYILCS
jgi:hypothetical protein